jgi:hypothetical protein
LNDEIRLAEVEWKNIDRNLLKSFVPSFLSAGIQLLIGQPQWVAGVLTAATGAARVIDSHSKHNSFLKNYPAGFFLERK